MRLALAAAALIEQDDAVFSGVEEAPHAGLGGAARAAVEAARATGMSEWRIAILHVLPNTVAPLILAMRAIAVLVIAGSPKNGNSALPLPP